MMSSKSLYIVVALLVCGTIKAEDFEAALAPFEVYDEQRMVGDKPFYRPDDDTPETRVNAFQELQLEDLPNNVDDIYFVGETGMASVFNLSDVMDRENPVTFATKINMESGALPCETVAIGDAKLLCQNYITVIQPIRDNKVIVCGTNELVPVCYKCTYDITTYTLSCPEASNDDKNYCPVDGTGDCYYMEESGITAHKPLQETAWLYIDDATLGEVVFAGADEDLGKDSVISRVNIDANGKLDLSTVLKTDKDDPNWLNNAAFIGDPIRYAGHVYFFFRETATEYINAGKIVYSRVGRVCEDDEGGPAGTTLQEKWTTFQKARLNCSTQGQFPFYFNELQDIHQASTDENIIYATFSTAETGATGSAVCVFRLDEIQQLFNEGSFKGAENPSDLWLPIPSSKVPDPRPGSCVTHPPSDFQFIKDYPLMDALVPNTRDYTTNQGYNRDSNSPLGILQGKRIVEMVVDEQVQDVAGNLHDIFFLASDDGAIFKMYMPSPDVPVLLEEFNLTLDTAVDEAVLTMELKDKKLYIGTTERVVAINVQHCDTYKKCYLCVQAQDPYCSFNSDDRCVSESTDPNAQQCLRETVDKKPFDCSKCRYDPDTEGYNWPRPMIAYASKDETRVSKVPLPVILYFTATGPKYSDISHEFDCTYTGDDSSCTGQKCTGLFTENKKYQRLDKVEWVSVTFTAEAWEQNCNATITYTAIANGEHITETSSIILDGSDLNTDTDFQNEIIKYDELMAAYKYNVTEWEEEAIKECYADDVTTCSPTE